MDKNDLSKSLVDFSKHLLVTIFAIFAFTSKTLLETHCLYVKYIYLLSLLFAILSLNFGFRGSLVEINYYLSKNNDDDAEVIKNLFLPSVKFKKIVQFIQYQYWSSLFALILLTLSIGVYLFSN
jgi:hypothetical protein